MFGSEFAKQFGLPGPPWETLDSFQGFFGPIAPQQQLPGSELLGEQLRAGPGAAQPPVMGMPGVQQPQQPDLAGAPAASNPAQGINPQAQPGQHLPFMEPTAKALAPGGTSGLNSEFARGG